MVLDEVLYEWWVLQLIRTFKHQLLRLASLCFEVLILAVFVETVHKFNEVAFQHVEVSCHGLLQGFERLLNKLLLCVLCRKREDVDDDSPAWLNVGGLSDADPSDTLDNEIFNLSPSVHVLDHDLLEWAQKVLLETERLEVFNHEELISQLPQTVNCELGNHWVLVTANPHEVLADRLPQLAPNEADAAHVNVSDKHKLLKWELAWVVLVWKLILGVTAKTTDEIDDGILLEQHRVMEDLLNHFHWNRVCNLLAIVLEDLLFR